MAEDAQASAVARMAECNRLLADTMMDIARLVAEADVPCELVRRGTYRAAVGEAARKSLAGYRRFLDAAGLPYAALDREALAARIGTRFYTEGLYSPDCHLAQPAALGGVRTCCVRHGGSHQHRDRAMDAGRGQQ